MSQGWNLPNNNPGDSLERKKWLLNGLQNYIKTLAKSIEFERSQRIDNIVKRYDKNVRRTTNAILAASAFIATSILALGASTFLELTKTQKSLAIELVAIILVVGITWYIAESLISRKAYQMLRNISIAYLMPSSMLNEISCKPL
jgi:nitrogenase molybdenum-iron protein alpha/beta subunit